MVPLVEAQGVVVAAGDCLTYSREEEKEARPEEGEGSRDVHVITGRAVIAAGAAVDAVAAGLGREHGSH